MASIDEQVQHIRHKMESGDRDGARWGLNKLLSRHADHPAVIAAQALFEFSGGQRDAAIARLTRAIRQSPGAASLHEELGMELHVVGNFPAAAMELREAIRLDPRRADSLELLCQQLMDHGEYVEAEPLVNQLIELAPERIESWNRQGLMQAFAGLLPEAEASMQRVAAALGPAGAAHASNRALLANFRDDISPAAVLAIHQAAAALVAPADPLPPLSRPIARSSRLRIGYVSPDFRQHSVMTFFEPVLRHHDRERFEITCYQISPLRDAITLRLQGMSEHWRDVSAMGNREAAMVMRDDAVNVLVDLAGHTSGNRLRIFAHKPSPAQVTWLGYPNTTGLPQMDFRLTDEIADPPAGESQAWTSERLVRLPSTFFCYGGPGIEAPAPARQPPCERAGVITFAIPTRVTKIRPAMITLWSRILQQVPQSRLVIHARGTELHAAQSWIMRTFEACGANLSNIELHARCEFPEYLALHDGWDIALDTLPFNGHTTTCHALWMGVPMVTLAGRMHAGRMGASVLHSIGLDDCVANDPEEYVQIAARLADEIKRRRDLRGTLRDRMRAAPMMNAGEFTTDLEATFSRLSLE